VTRADIETQLRQATLIIPQTGERVKKRVTLQSLDGEYDTLSNPVESSGETSPLLRRRSLPSAYKRRGNRSKIWQRCKTAAAQIRAFMVSETGMGVLKCSFAYVLGSLATFVLPISSLLGQQDGKHMVATITVYFHPARSIGSMLEALVFAFTAFIYAAFVCVTSMAVSVFFTDTLDLMSLGHAIVLVVFVGGGLGFVGWIKQRLGDPLVNVACSLTCLAIITVLTKEGAVQAGDFSFAKIWQVLKMLIMGVVATMAVSFLIFPISARSKLRKDMVDVTDSLADMLAVITSSFLSGIEEELGEVRFLDATEQHKKSYSTLGKNLKESKYENYVLGTERRYSIEAKLVHCVQRITQSIGGLRSAAAMQFIVVKEPPPRSRGERSGRDLDSYGSTLSTPLNFRSPSRTFSGELSTSTLPAIDEVPDEEDRDDDAIVGAGGRRASHIKSPAEIFSLFIAHLGPCMHSMAFTLKEILDELPYGPAPNYQIKVNPKFRTSLRRALELYTAARKEALKVVYNQNDMDRTRPIEVQADWEEAAASCGHFSFCLLEVAEQVTEYLRILDELQLEVEEQPTGSRSWNWLKFWTSSRDGSQDSGVDPDLVALVDHADNLDLEVNLPKRKEPSTSDSISSAYDKSPGKTRFFHQLWTKLSVFRRDDTKFAIKVGIGAALFALPSYIDRTRPVYAHWRGEWGLVSYMLVCSMTIGASNTTGYSRFLGTFIGAVCAIAAWEMAHDNPFVLALLGWMMAYWTAYIIVARGKGPMGRYIMLTYNLSALYAYSLSVKDEQNDEDEGGSRPLIMEITLHRVVAVLSGCIWGLIITRIVWPISARQKLKDGLSLIWLRMGLIWKRDPLAMFIDGEHPKYYMNLREEFELQKFLSTLEKMRDSAKSEFEFKGPFLDKVYARILRSTGRMLDAFHAMNVVILKDLVGKKGELELLKATTRERAQLCSRISHLFSVLASSMKLEYPLNDALPNTDHTRDRLLARIFAYRKDEAAANGTTDEDFGLLYAYALVTGQLSQEIKEVLRQVENLFGILDEELLKLQ
jgi:Fusaric acid resistance protein-like